ncbi:MAG: hypothetical protein R6U89_02355, partial [Dehalococcoidia bacterium]
QRMVNFPEGIKCDDYCGGERLTGHHRVSLLQKPEFAELVRAPNRFMERGADTRGRRNTSAGAVITGSSPSPPQAASYPASATIRRNDCDVLP